MTIKEMNCVQDAIRHAKETIAELGCENYPFTPFADADFEKMFYELNEMCLTISAKINAMEGVEQ